MFRFHAYFISAITLKCKKMQLKFLHSLKCIGMTTGLALLTSFSSTGQQNALDQSFSANPGSDSGFGTGLPCRVRKIVQQPDGKFLIGGYFKTYNGVSRNSIARLNNDGSLDASFNPGTGFEMSGNPGDVIDIDIQSDGKILVTNSASTFNSVQTKPIIRLNADGTLDPSFDLQYTGIGSQTLLLQPDGKIIYYTARINSDGSEDLSYSGAFGAMALQSDGKVITGGVNPKRLNTDGSIDNTFQVPGFGFNAGPSMAAVQPDGKIIFSGTFATFNGINRNKFARLNADGTLDPNFNSPTSGFLNTPNAILLQPNGMLLVGSNMSFYRLQTNGNFDQSFQTPQINGHVLCLYMQQDGKILTGGEFSEINLVTLGRVARFKGLSATSVSEMSNANNFSVYPNPSKGLLNIDLIAMPSQPVKLQVINALGSVVHQEILKEKTAQIRLDCPDGVYFLKLDNQDIRATQTIILHQ
jgi:uncharacterized delta-60 repeat protein